MNRDPLIPVQNISPKCSYEDREAINRAKARLDPQNGRT